MKAIAIVPGTKIIQLEDRPEPSISVPDEVKIRMKRVGICGTDREEAAGGRALAPTGQKSLVIGHEMFGQVVEVGKDVTQVRPGDYAIFTDRRGCGKCMPCAMNRSDMCNTGDFRERGIWGLDGFQAEYVVDKEQYVVRVPPELESVGVLAEPLSVAEKAIDEAVRVQFARLPDAMATPDWLNGRRCLVAGLGPIGLLAAVALRLRGAEVYGMDIVDENSPRPEWLEKLGGKYIDGRTVSPDKIGAMVGPMNLIFDATGVAKLEFNLLDALAYNGVYVLTGIPGGGRLLEVSGAELIRQLVLKNQLVIGSVNNPRAYFQMAVDDLTTARLRWENHLERLITHRHPYTDFAAALEHHGDDEIKVVLEWSA
ncbi:MAG TPA: glucose 1-dehydrogenase [Thermodesulfobacteriota bacterium]|nr:glucose 1-dehydrogenase [Thermodesulfobacteriota bacterium]